MDNKDKSELFEDLCNIARVLPNLAASTIYSDLKNMKDDPNRVKLILRKYFASYEPEEHNCMSDDIKKIKRVLPEYPFIHINNDLLEVERKENRVQLVLKKYFDNQARAAKRSLLLDNVDSPISSPEKRFKSSEDTTEPPSVINTAQIRNSEEKEQSSNETETESYTVASDEFQPADFRFDHAEICQTAPETSKEEHLFENHVTINANDQNSNVSKEANIDHCEENIKLLENPTSTNDQNTNVSEETEDYQCEKPNEFNSISDEQRENNETEKSSLLSILSNLFPQHSTDVFNFFCQDFGIDLHTTPNENTVDLVVSSLINYCSPEEYTDEVKATEVCSVSDDDQQNLVTGCAQSSHDVQDDIADDLQNFFRETVENILLNVCDKEQSSKNNTEESNIVVQTSPINKEPVQTPHTVVEDILELHVNSNYPTSDANTALNDLQNFLNCAPDSNPEILKSCRNPETSQLTKPACTSQFNVPFDVPSTSTNIPELSTIKTLDSAQPPNALLHLILNSPSSSNIPETSGNPNKLNFETNISKSPNPTTRTSHFVNNTVPSTSTLVSSTSTNIPESSLVDTADINQSSRALLHSLIQTFDPKYTENIPKAKKNCDTLNFESALLNNILPELNPAINMATKPGTSETTKSKGATSRPNIILKPASFHPRTSTITSGQTTGGNFARNSKSIIKPASFQPRIKTTTSSNQNMLAAGIYTTANTKVINSSNPSCSSSFTKRDINSSKLSSKVFKVPNSKVLPISKTSVKTTSNPTPRTTPNPNPPKTYPGSRSKPIPSISSTVSANPSTSKSNKNIEPLTKASTKVNYPGTSTNSSNPSCSSSYTKREVNSTKFNLNSKVHTISKTSTKTTANPTLRTTPNPNPPKTFPGSTTSAIASTSKSNRNITEQLTKASTKANYSGSSTNSISGGSSKQLINAKPENLVTLENTSVCTCCDQQINHQIPSTSGSTCSFSVRKQDINKNTIRVRTDLYDTYFNGPVLQSAELSMPTIKPKITKKEENDDIIFISADRIPTKKTTVSSPIIIDDLLNQNITNDTSVNNRASSSTSIPKIEEKSVVTKIDIQPSTSKASETHPYYFKLLEIFPDICPEYLRSLCFKSTENQTLDDLISILLNGDYKRRDRADSPENHLDFEEQHKILQDLFPDADPTYLQHHCERLIDQPDKFKQFVASLLENKDFPTKVEYLKKMKLSAQEKQYTTEFDVKKFLDIIPNPEEFFNDPKRQVSFDNFDDTNYAVTFLKNTFCTTAIKDITSKFKKNNYSILRTTVDLENIQNMKTKRKPYPVTSCKNIPLLQEIAYVKHKKQILKYLAEQELEKKLAREQAKTDGLMKTCQCCYDDEVMPDDTATCEAGLHIFCKDCIRRGCEVLIGDGKLDFPCLESCESFFTVQVLQTVLTPKVFSKMAQRKQMEEVKSAGIDDLEFCPFCDFATIPAPGDKVFRCLNSDCMKESCRLCKEPSHIPLRCDEVEKDKDVKMRTYIEDKMTEALLRKCWKCGMKFIKESGCNKMTCSCGALMCYVCNQPVKDYKHFNGQGGDQTQLCPLYSDTHKLHVDAVKRGAESAKKELGVQENQLKIDPTVDLEQHYRRLATQNPAIPNIPVMLPQNILPP